jgi:hypothetical protein
MLAHIVNLCAGRSNRMGAICVARRWWFEPEMIFEPEEEE